MTKEICTVHIPPAYQTIKDRVEADSVAEIHEGNKPQLLNDLGITAAVQVCSFLRIHTILDDSNAL